MAPDDLVDIYTACNSRGKFSVLGVVVDTLPIYRTKGSSACITFTIKDSDFDGPTWQGGLKVKYFNDDESHLPNVRLNDAVLLHSIRVTIYQNKPTGIVSQQDRVSWIIFRPDPSPSSSPFITSGPIPFEPSLKEQAQAVSLLERVSGERIPVQPAALQGTSGSKRMRDSQVPSPAPKTGGLDLKNIEAAKSGALCQLLGQVVKLYTHDSEKCLLWMTDYTENDQLTHHKKPGEDDDSGLEGDRFGYVSGKTKDWPGPWGKLSILVTLWEPHAAFARENLTPGDIVLLTYVRIKESRSLEAAVHEDRRFPEKIHVRKIHDHNDERVKALMDRRTEYWKIHGEPKTDTKKSKKRNKKTEQKKEARVEEGQLRLAPGYRVKMNPNVKTRNYTVPVLPLEKILQAETHINNAPGGVVYQLPFQNVNYHSQVRVVDFFPPRIEDFAVQISTAPLFGAQSDETECSSGWVWRFCLLVEGVGPRSSKQEPREVTRLYVSGEDGDYLLDDSAFDLRSDEKRLDIVKEKLFILWGDLEEKKSNARASGNQDWGNVSSLPFECCIKEYGVECTHRKNHNAMEIDGDVCSQPDCFGWERRFAMFGTTIHT